MFYHLLKIRNCKLKIAFFALILFLLMAKNVDASVINKSPNYLGSSNGLVGYWTMDGSNVNWKTGLIIDSSGKNNSGIMKNMATSTATVPGKIGQALNFDGTNDQVTFTSVPPGFNVSEGTMSLWFSLQPMSNYGELVNVRTDGNNEVSAGWVNSKNQFRFAYTAGGTIKSVSTSTISENNIWYHSAMTWSKSNDQLKVYFSGIQASTTQTNLGTWVGAPTIFTFGNDPFNEFLKGKMDDIRIYNRVLSAAEILTIYNSSAAKFNVSPTNYLTSGLVGYWTMDGSKVNWKTGAVTDSSGFGNTGTITNMATSTGVAIGKIGQALNFDGGDDYVNMGNVSVLNMGLSDWTTSAWIKSTGINGWIVGKLSIVDGGNPDAWFFNINNSGRIACSIFKSGRTRINSTDDGALINDNKWHHVVCVWNRAGSMIRYVDGVANGSATSISSESAQSISNNQQAFIGARDNSPPDLFFIGSTDDVRVYNRALTAKEIQTLYNIGATTKFNVSPTKYLTTGLVGYWTMDGKDTPWTSATAATTVDKSGKGNTGTLTNMSQSISPIAGKVGQGLSFDGSDDFISMADANVYDFGVNENFSVAFWVKYNNNTANNAAIVEKWSGAGGYPFVFRISGGNPKQVLMARYDSTNNPNVSTATVTPLATWFHVVGVKSGSNLFMYANGILQNSSTDTTTGVTSNNSLLYIGQRGDGSNRFNGLIDDVRVYNRALSANEVSQLYNMGR